MQVPETHYAPSGDVHIAYQVVGDGPNDVVFIPGSVSNLELGWQEPRLANFYERLASFSRLILFDKRGTGLSDRVTGIPPLEIRMDDVRAVMDTVGSARAALLGISEGGPMTALFAATYPERTTAAILYGSSGARAAWAPDYPIGRPQADWERIVAELEQRWGDREYLEADYRDIAPSLAEDEEARRWFVNLCRLSASPGAIVALARMNRQIDIRHVLPAIHVPTLIVHRTGDSIPVERSRYMAELVSGARYVELPGADHVPWADGDQILDVVERFLAETWERRATAESEPDRVLATVLFTDIVGSTQRAAELGDRAWRELLERHHAVIRQELATFRGREVDTAGDGFFASFDGPARAIRCACAIRDKVWALGLEVRAGLHTGECELLEGKVSGIAVATGARVSAHAGPGEVLVSQTVRDLVAGSGISFDDRGTTQLKGVPGDWRLYAVGDS